MFDILHPCFRVHDQIFVSPTEHITGNTISRQNSINYTYVRSIYSVLV